MLLKLVTNEKEWWSLKSVKWCFTRWNCHIWQLVWLLLLEQCHVNTKYQSWCFYNIAYIQPNAPPVCHCLDKSSHKLGIGWAYVAMLDWNISVRPLCSLRLHLFDQNTVKKHVIMIYYLLYIHWLWKKSIEYIQHIYKLTKNPNKNKVLSHNLHANCSVAFWLRMVPRVLEAVHW